MPVAVVTGSNKGIGLSTVRGLCKQFQGDVVLTSRNTENGLQAVAELEKENLSPKFHQLDINDEQSLANLAKFLKDKYGGIDILVNNAAIFKETFKNEKMMKNDDVAKIAKETTETNYWANKVSKIIDY